MANEHSNIVPNMSPTAKVSDFKFWCQKVLPLVYDDSLSYYEVLNKLVVYLNQVIANVNADIDNVEELEADFLLLQSYVNNFFDDIDQLVSYAERAEAAETSAIGYAASAAESATNASTSALNAMDAKDAAVIAKNQAQAALTNAQTAATNAAASATAADTSATNAAASATSASGYATNASASATAAQNSFTLADAARSAAQTAATNADASATAAAGSATDAASSATAAAASAASADGEKAQEMISESEEESTTATSEHNIGTYFRLNGVLYRATENIQIGDTISTSTNCEEIHVDEVLTAQSEQIGELKNAVVELNDDVEQTIVLEPVWTRGRFNNSGEDLTSTRFVRSVTPIPVYADTLHVDFSGSYSSYPQYLVAITYNGSTRVVSKTASADIEISYGSQVRFLLNTTSSDSTTVIDVNNADDYLTASYKSKNLETDKTLKLSGRPADAKAVGNEIFIKKYEPLLWETGSYSSTGTKANSTNPAYKRTAYLQPVQTAPIYIDILQYYIVNLCIFANDGTFSSYKRVYTGALDLTAGQKYTLYFSKEDSSNLTDADIENIKVYTITTPQNVLIAEQNATLDNCLAFSMIKNFAVLGDSWASGSIHYPNGNEATTQYEMSWGQILARRNGATALNFSKGGLSTKTWLSDSEYGLAAMLAADQQQLYLCNFGINDNTAISGGTYTLGSTADIKEDYTENPDTFYGNYARIIGNIKTHSPKALIVLLSVARPMERNMDSAIKEIATTCNVPFVDLTESSYFISEPFYKSIYDGHPLAFGYAGMAKAIEELFSKCVLDNVSYFQNYDGTTGE